MGKAARESLSQRLTAATVQPEVVAVREFVKATSNDIELMLWIDVWSTLWTASSAAFASSTEGTAKWGNEAIKCFRLLVRLEQALGPMRTALPTLRSGRKTSVETWKRRLVIDFLKTGIYSGPGIHDLRPPDPLWTNEELTRLAIDAEWADVLRDITRSRVRVSFPGIPKVLPDAWNIWPIIRPFLLGRTVHPEVAWGSWSRIVLDLAKRLSSNALTDGPENLLAPETTRRHLLRASELLKKLADQIEPARRPLP